MSGEKATLNSSVSSPTQTGPDALTLILANLKVIVPNCIFDRFNDELAYFMPSINTFTVISPLDK